MFRVYVLVVTGVFVFFLCHYIQLQKVVSDPEENYNTGLGFGYVFCVYALVISSVIFVVSFLYGMLHFFEKR